MKNIAILGSTGSIGTQTLDVIRYNDDLKLVAISAGSNIILLEEQIREFHPELVAVWSESKAKELRTAVADVTPAVKVVSGMDGLLQVATIASAFFFTSVVSENAEELRNNAPTGEYEYTHIKDDEEFVTYMKQKAIAFRSPKSFDQQEESFRNLSEIEMSLTELYAYEMLSVDAIESVTDVDSSYISGWLAGIRSYVLGYETAGNADNNDMAAVADNDYNSLDESDYSDEEYDDSDYGYDENNNNDDYREREAVSSVYRKTGKTGRSDPRRVHRKQSAFCILPQIPGKTDQAVSDG